MSTSDPDAGERRRRLLGVKLRALVRDHTGADPGAPAEFAPGSAVVADNRAWVLIDDATGPRLGAALAWAVRAGAQRLDVIAEQHAGTIARRAGGFAFPIAVWRADGANLVEAAAAPLPAPVPASAAHLELRELIAAGGATPGVEHGVVFGEVRGLEVCRVVDDPHLDVVRLEVGVGVHDREAFQMVHGDVPTVASLARIVDAVVAHRRVGADPHPLNRIGRERFLRWRLEQDPSMVGATSLQPAAPPIPRANVKDEVPCVAVGADAHGHRVAVVCSAGVDLELVPFVADVRRALDAHDARAGAGIVGEAGAARSRLVLAVPTRDRLPVLDVMVDLLADADGWSAVDVVTVD